jgi:hypothetical protein
MNGFLCPDNGGGPGQRQRGEAQNTELKQKTSFSHHHQLALQSLFGLQVTCCAQLFSLAETPQPPPSIPAFGLTYERRYWISQNRRLIFINP